LLHFQRLDTQRDTITPARPDSQLDVAAISDTSSAGTPAGVGMGRSPQRWLKAVDEMVVAIEGIGELRNMVVGE
jgi:hypothetical protein